MARFSLQDRFESIAFDTSKLKARQSARVVARSRASSYVAEVVDDSEISAGVETFRSILPLEDDAVLWSMKKATS